MSSLVRRMIYVAVDQIRRSVAFAQLSLLRKIYWNEFLKEHSPRWWKFVNFMQYFTSRRQVSNFMLKIYFYAKLNRQRQQHSTCINVSYRILRWRHFSVGNLLILLSLTSCQKCEAIISAATAQLSHPLIILSQFDAFLTNSCHFVAVTNHSWDHDYLSWW